MTVFASGLNFPYSMQAAPDGALLVGGTVPSGAASWGNYYFGSGQLLRLADANHDGTADGPPAVVASGLPGAVTVVRQVGNLWLVGTTGNTTWAGVRQCDFVFLKPGADPLAPYTQVGDIRFTLPAGSAPNLTAAVQPSAGISGQYDVYFGLEAESNDGTPGDPATVSGLVSGQLPAGSLYHMTVQPTSGPPVVSMPEQIASGIRNTAGMLIDASTGDLYFGDNGYENGSTPVDVDELDRIPAGDLGAGVQFFGYPGNYTAYQAGTFKGGLGIPALVPFQPWPDPDTGVWSTGISELALAPSAFPSGFNDGMFVGFHGNFYGAGTDNVLNPLVYVDLRTGQYVHFIEAGQAGMGHLDTLLTDGNAMYIADFSSTGAFDSGAGVIYRLTAAPEPGSAGLAVAGWLWAAMLWRRRVRR